MAEPGSGTNPALLPAEASAGPSDRDPISGRFTKGNKASRKHGLRALSGGEMQPRHNRAGWLLKHLVNELENEGRKLQGRHLRRARRWCELEVIASDAYDELTSREFPKAVDGNEKLWEIYRAAVNDQGRIGGELRLTPASEERIRESEPDLVKQWAVQAARRSRQ